MVTYRHILIKLGNNIRIFREELGYSQEQFAKIAHLDRSYYGRVERGERNLSLINLLKISFALNKTIGDLLPPIDELKKYF
jgi:transcriptional regulator with XRE-family HTH domain